jgi:hypothetical protein
LDISSIQYVIVSIRVRDNAEDWIGTDYNRDRYIRELDKLPYLEKVNAGTKDIVIYENKNYKPHIYTTSSQESLTQRVPYQTVEYSLIHPTEYKVRLEKVKQPLYLHFSEAYHPQWKIRVGDFNRFASVMDEEYFIPEKYHRLNYPNLQSFELNPQELCRQYSCTMNNDGTYNFDLTLYFRPQTYLYIGLIISGSVLIICIIYLVYEGLKYIKEK